MDSAKRFTLMYLVQAWCVATPAPRCNRRVSVPADIHRLGHAGSPREVFLSG